MILAFATRIDGKSRSKFERKTMVSENLGSIYKELGVTPIINAIGSVTMLGGSTPIPEVREAMALAGDSYIPLME